jgi:hypothetical protein
LLSPNGGEICPTTFTWTYSGLAANARIKFDLFKGPGPIYQPGTPFIGIMDEGIPVGDQTYTWNGRMLDGSTLPAGNDYWIVIQTMDFGAANVEDASDAPFNICEVTGTLLEISPTDSRKLAINKKEIFLLEVSYFDPHALDTSNPTYKNLLENDLDLLKQYGFNCIRVCANDLDFPAFIKDPDTATYYKPNHDTNYKRMKTLIEICESKGIVIDFTLFVYPYNTNVNYINWYNNMPQSLEEAKSYLNVFTTAFQGYKNWFWDVFNEWDSHRTDTWWIPPLDNCIDNVCVVQELLAQVKLKDSERLCTASGNSTDSAFLGDANLNIIAPHTDHCNWAKDENKERNDFMSVDVLEEFRTHTGKPIHLQEPPRRGYKCIPLTYDSYFPPASRFINDLTAVRWSTDAAAAGWCLHNHKTCVDFSFNEDGSCMNGSVPKCENLNDKDGMLLTGGPTGSGQLDDVEKDVVYAAAGIIGNPPESFFIMPTAGAGGMISPSDRVVVSKGESQTFTIAANSGYGILGVKVDGVDQGAITSFPFNNVQTNHTIAATFFTLPVYYTITATARAHGSISPGSIVVSQGASQTFQIKADPGYWVQSVIVDGDFKGVITSYKFDNIQADHTIAATFDSTPIVPAGAIVPFNSTAAIPSGWNVWTSANGKYIVGAGSSYAVGANSAAGTKLTKTTNSSGDHSGSRLNKIGTGTVNWAGNSYAGNHAHTLTMTYTPAYRQLILIKSNTTLPAFPIDAVVFSKSDLSASLTNIFSGANKLFKAGASRAGAAASVVVNSVSLAGAHTHGTKSGTGTIQRGSGCYSVPNAGNHNDHACTAVLNTDKVKKAILTAWSNAAQSFPPIPGVIAMYESTTPPPGWVLCDGNNGTVDLRNYFIYIGTTANHGTSSGNNTVRVDITIGESLWSHSHSVPVELAPGTSGYSWHDKWTFPHSHDGKIISSSHAFVPAYYALVFIQKI